MTLVVRARKRAETKWTRFELRLSCCRAFSVSANCSQRRERAAELPLSAAPLEWAPPRQQRRRQSEAFARSCSRCCGGGGGSATFAFNVTAELRRHLESFVCVRNGPGSGARAEPEAAGESEPPPLQSNFQTNRGERSASNALKSIRPLYSVEPLQFGGGGGGGSCNARNKCHLPPADTLHCCAD